MPNIFKKLKNDNRGGILLVAIMFGVIGFALTVGAITSYAISENLASEIKYKREMAFQIADAGINYYRWHLAHNKIDYYDGQGASSTGPYVHEYTDKSGNLLGYFSLDITPPKLGSTVVEIKSTGYHKDYPNSKRSIKVRVGFPSLTDYSLLTNTDIWIGDTESTHGKFQANGGVRFDGTGDAPIMSAMETYICQYYHGCSSGGTKKPGIWGVGSPQNLWQFPMPAKDFDAVTVKLSEIKEQAEASGINLSSSGEQGWSLSFKADGTVDVSKVLSTNCYQAKDVGASSYDRYCIDLKTKSTAVNYPVPSNGYIFVDDMVWVDGTVNGRVVVGTGTGKSIIINGNILYLSKDDDNVLGLIASKDILIPRDSPNYLEIDAAMLAQTGATKRYYYSGNLKESISIYGSLITSGIWTWNWSSGYSIVSGYKKTDSTYDVNLTYNPPPSFPVGSEYNLISWEEVAP